MGRNIDENENLARAPLALADSFETSLPPCFQRKFVDENGSMWPGGKVQRFREIRGNCCQRWNSDVQGKPP